MGDMVEVLEFVEELQQELLEETPWGWETALDYLERVHEALFLASKAKD